LSEIGLDDDRTPGKYLSVGWRKARNKKGCFEGREWCPGAALNVAPIAGVSGRSA
jgi:hypothetical protein